MNSSDARVTLDEQWTGRTWRTRATPSPGARLSVLSAVSCPAAARCVAVRYYGSRAGNHQTLAEEWDGRTWRLLAARSPGDLVNELTGVSCTASAACLAVGDDGTAEEFPATRPLGEIWTAAGGGCWPPRALPASWPPVLCRSRQRLPVLAALRSLTCPRAANKLAMPWSPRPREPG